MASTAAAYEGPSQGKLRRELRFWEAIAISIGIMAPTAAMALNGVAPAGIIGRAVPLAFLFAAIAIALISYSFVRLTRYFNHAGSTYALAGATLGARFGFFAGWALLATYSCFLAADIAEVGLFGTSFLSSTHIWSNPSWILVALIAAALIWFLAYGDVKIATRALLSFEGISVTLIVILVVVIFWKVIGHTAPNHQGFTLKPFIPASGTTVGAVAFASVFGLLSFGGFEGAAALGEETNNPRRNIPLAIAVAVLAIAGASSTRSSCIAQTIGFYIGADAGTKAFASSTAPLGDLAGSTSAAACRTRSISARHSPRSRAGSAALRVPRASCSRSGAMASSRGVSATRRGEPARPPTRCWSSWPSGSSSRRRSESTTRPR